MFLCDNQTVLQRRTGLTVSDISVFEQPLNERIRTFLRLEHLFCQYEQHMKHTSAWDTQSAIKAIIDLLSMLGRGDTKRETIKELERQNVNLKSFIEIPDIDHGRLALLIDDQKKCIEELHAVSGNIGHSLQSNELLNAIRQRLTVPGGLCDFDLPAYSHWLNQPFENRQSVLNEWFEPLRVLDRKSTRLNSSHRCISYAVFCLKKKKINKKKKKNGQGIIIGRHM